jgi:hypothetical protein
MYVYAAVQQAPHQQPPQKTNWALHAPAAEAAIPSLSVPLQESARLPVCPLQELMSPLPLIETYQFQEIDFGGWVLDETFDH